MKGDLWNVEHTYIEVVCRERRGNLVNLCLYSTQSFFAWQTVEEKYSIC